MVNVLQNAQCEVAIKSLGAELCSFRDKNSGIEYIWQADEAHWARHAPILFPIIGKLKDNQYKYKAQTYQMTQHGFARDALFRVVEQTETSITFELTDDQESFQRYPVHFTLHVIYTLDNRRLLIQYRVLNTDKTTIHISIGGHPAFNCPLLPTEQRSDYHLLFEEKEEANAFVLDKGLLTDNQQSVIQHGNVIPISDNLFERDALIFKDLKSSAITLAHNAGKPIISFEFPNTPYLGIWSMSQTSPFVCIEPWFGLADHCQSDHNFTQKEGMMTLAPQGEFSSEYIIEIH
ncbi:MAG: aldose 1-epimerase family protein [Pseudomonadota bacterium]